MATGIVNWVIAIVTFGALGWLMGRRRSMSTGPIAYVLLVVAAIIGLFIGKSTILVGVDEYGLYLNRAIFSICIGVSLGSAFYGLKLRRVENA